MIVLDASAAVDLLLDTASSETVAEHIAAAEGEVHAPHLLDVEVGQVLRRYILGREITLQRAMAALTRLSELPITRYPHLPLLERALEIRRNLTVYDAVYVALAEVLEVPLLTSDAALSRVRGVTVRIVLVR